MPTSISNPIPYLFSKPLRLNFYRSCSHLACGQSFRSPGLCSRAAASWSPCGQRLSDGFQFTPNLKIKDLYGECTGPPSKSYCHKVHNIHFFKSQNVKLATLLLPEVHSRRHEVGLRAASLVGASLALLAHLGFS